MNLPQYPPTSQLQAPQSFLIKLLGLTLSAGLILLITQPQKKSRVIVVNETPPLKASLPSGLPLLPSGLFTPDPPQTPTWPHPQQTPGDVVQAQPTPQSPPLGLNPGCIIPTLC